VRVVDRNAQDRVRPEQATGVAGDHVGGADMRAGGTRGQRHVDPVIDEERDPERAQARQDRARVGDELARSTGLVAVLEQRGPAPRRGGGELGQWPIAAACRIEDRVDAQVGARARPHASLARRARASSSSV
jgi:hypothetical protein